MLWAHAKFDPDKIILNKTIQKSNEPKYALPIIEMSQERLKDTPQTVLEEILARTDRLDLATSKSHLTLRLKGFTIGPHLTQTMCSLKIVRHEKYANETILMHKRSL